MDRDMLVMDHPNDFNNYNQILCSTLLIYGIIGPFIEPYVQLIIKGGRATQLVVNDVYETEDIDVLILSKDINANLQNIGGNICYLVNWFLQEHFNISILPPTNRGDGTPPIYKLSYKKYIGRGFKQFSDIDFTPPQTHYFENLRTYPFITKDDLDTNIAFTIPNIGDMLNEKLYYYNEYKDDSRMANKFAKAIRAMNYELAMKKNKSPSEILQRRIDALQLQNNITVEDILNVNQL